MVLEKDDIVHVVIRRTFEGDLRRHFIGEIIDCSGAIAKLRGNTILFDRGKNQFIKKPEIRTTIMNLAESGYIVNFIPKNVLLDSLQYAFSKDHKLFLTDWQILSLGH